MTRGANDGGGIPLDIFDIIGPVMIGPSSSHTAGAARIGRAARGLMESGLDAEAIARKAMAIAADICVYTNGNLTVEILG